MTPTIDPTLKLKTELETYLRLKPELLTIAEGRFVLIKHDRVEGFYDDWNTGVSEGYRRFGYGDMFVHQVLDEEPVTFMGIAFQT